MEDSPEPWDCWLNEDLKLESGAPMDISDSLWDNFALQSGNDSVARSLFSCTMQANDSSSGIREGSPSQTLSCWPNASPASECMLNLLAEDPVSSSPCLSDSFEGCDGSFTSACKDPASSHSMWFVPYEESLSSSPRNDSMEQSAESWMAGCFTDDKDMSLQEAMLPESSLRDAMASEACQAGAQGTLSRARQGRKALKMYQDSAGPLTAANMAKLNNPRGGKHAPKQKLVRSLSDTQALQASTKPVVYPFALVKPSGIQGDATLKDINERINMLSSSQSRPPCSPPPPSSSPFSGKPVVAVTKIHTEGKGIITIMRTRS